jgi:hypothetical protein
LGIYIFSHQSYNKFVINADCFLYENLQFFGFGIFLVDLVDFQLFANLLLAFLNKKRTKTERLSVGALPGFIRAGYGRCPYISGQPHFPVL